MAKSGLSKVPSRAGKEQSQLVPPIPSPLKKPRTRVTKPTILRPEALRSIVDRKQKSLTDMLGTLSQTPKCLKVTRAQKALPSVSSKPSNPSKSVKTNLELRRSPKPMKVASAQKVPPPVSSKPKNAHKSLKATLELRRSPRKHVQTANPLKKVHQCQAPTSKNIEPQPKNQKASQTTVDNEEDHELDSDVDERVETRGKDTSTYQLIDEDNVSEDNEVMPQDRLNSEIEQDKERDDNHDFVLPVRHGEEGLQKGNANDDVDAAAEQDEECEEDEDGGLEDKDSDNEELVHNGNAADNEELVHNGNADDDDVAAAAEVQKPRKSRGKTRCLNMIGLDFKPTVILNRSNQPIGPRPFIKSLAPSIGILATNPEVVSLANKSWTQVSDDVKTDIWQQLSNTWNIPELARKWVMKSASDSFRCNKSRLKARYFNQHMSYAQLLNNRPEEVPVDQWRALLAYWLDDKTKERAFKNQQSAAQRKNMHTAGSKSFARIIASEFTDGEEPSLAQVYIRTRTKSDGALVVDEKTREELNKIKDDDGRVEEYLLTKKLINKRGGLVPLKGRGVTPSDLKKRKYEEEVEKKSDDKIQQIQEDCKAKMKMMEKKFTRAIQNVVAMFQSPNQNVDFSTFNPFKDCEVYEDDTPREVGQSSRANDSSSPDNSSTPEDLNDADDDDLDVQLDD